VLRKWLDSWRRDPSRDPRPAIVNFFVYTAAMILFIQVQVVAKQQTDSNFLVGLATAAYHLPYFLFGVFFGRLGDFIRRRVIVFAGCITAALGSLLIGLFMESYPALMIGRALTGIGMGMLPGALFASTVERKASVGILAALGSLGWTLGSFLAPGLGSRPLTFFIAAGMALLPAFLGPSFRELPQRPKTKFFSFAVIARYWPIFTGFFLRHTGALSIWVTFTLFLNQRGVYGPLIPGIAIIDLMGLIYALNPLGQVFFMLFIERLKPKITLPLGYILSIVVFLGYIVIPNPWLFIPLQIILAFSWAAVYLGSLIYLCRSCAEERSTISGTFNAVMGLCGICGSLLGGALSTVSYELSMIVAAGLAFAGLAVVFFGERRLFRPQPVTA
jgi:MFS family permease